MKRQKTINEVASEREIELWKEYYRKNPDKWQKVLHDATLARAFLDKLAAAMREDD